MSEQGQVTDDDRQRAAEVLAEGGWYRTDVPLRDAVAQALADERERERAEWNPIVGRVLGLARELAATPLSLYSDGPAVRRDIAEMIHDAVRGTS